LRGRTGDECDGLRFDSPDDVAVVWGAKAKPPVFRSNSPGGFALIVRAWLFFSPLPIPRRRFLGPLAGKLGFQFGNACFEAGNFGSVSNASLRPCSGGFQLGDIAALPFCTGAVHEAPRAREAIIA